MNITLTMRAAAGFFAAGSMAQAAFLANKSGSSGDGRANQGALLAKGAPDGVMPRAFAAQRSE